MPNYGGYARHYANPFSDPGLWGRIQGDTSGFLDEDPSAGYGLFTGNLAGPSNLKRWLENQYNRLYGGYKGEAAFDPTLRWVDFLARQNLGNIYGAVSPYERGERPGLFAPRVRSSGY